MRRIFSIPHTVNIWLGPEENDSTHVIELLKQPMDWLEVPVAFFRGLQSLLNQPIFQRVWAVQEIALAKMDAPILHAGLSACSLENLANIKDFDCLRECRKEIVALLRGQLERLEYKETKLIDTYSRLAHYIAFRSQRLQAHAIIQESDNKAKDVHAIAQELLERDEALRELIIAFMEAPAYRTMGIRKALRGPNDRIAEVLILTLRHEATDPRDKIYGVLGVCSESHIDVNYSRSKTQVYVEATIAIKRAKRKLPTTKRVEVYSRPLMKDVMREDTHPPSWTIDFSYTHKQYADELSYHLDRLAIRIMMEAMPT